MTGVQTCALPICTGSRDGTNGGNGSPNTGSGSGGNATGINNGGNGGKGIVIIRYSGSQAAGGGNYSSSGGYSIHTFTGDGTFVSNTLGYLVN